MRLRPISIKFLDLNSAELTDLGLPDLKLHPANPTNDPQRVVDAFPTTKGKLVFLVDSRQSNGRAAISQKSVRLPKPK